MGEGRFAPPLAIRQTIGPILDPKTVFAIFGLELSEYVAKFYMNVTDDVTGRVKGQIFTICHCWLCRAKHPYQIEIKPMERHGSCLGYF